MQALPSRVAGQVGEEAMKREVIWPNGTTAGWYEDGRGVVLCRQLRGQARSDGRLVARLLKKKANAAAQSQALFPDEVQVTNETWTAEDEQRLHDAQARLRELEQRAREDVCS